jgi:hypothetical protein
MRNQREQVAALENGILHSHRRENIKSYIVKIMGYGFIE